MGTHIKINAILLNIKINQRELANMCRYKLAIYWQNFIEIYSTGVKILQKVLGGYFFESHCILETIQDRCHCLAPLHSTIQQLLTNLKHATRVWCVRPVKNSISQRNKLQITLNAITVKTGKSFTCVTLSKARVKCM